MGEQQENKNTAQGYNIASLVCNTCSVVFWVLAGIFSFIIFFATVLNNNK